MNYNGCAPQRFAAIVANTNVHNDPSAWYVYNLHLTLRLPFPIHLGFITQKTLLSLRRHPGIINAFFGTFA